MKKKRKIYTVTGKTGRGKTYFIENWLVPGIVKNKPVVIADSMNEYTAGLRFSSFDQFYTHIRSRGGFISDSDIKRNEVYIVQIKSDLEAKKLFSFSASCEAVHCLVVEEASKYCSAYTINDDLNRLIAYGRHDGISLVFTAQRFAQLSKMVTSQTDIFVSFAQTEQNDVKIIKAYTDNFDKIQHLSKQKFVFFGDVDNVPGVSIDSVYTLKSGKLTTVK